MGVMVFGHPHDERVIFNQERLYEPLYDEASAPPQVAHAIPELRRLLLAGKYVEARKYFAKQARAAGHDELLWTDPYHPAMAMTIRPTPATSFSNLRRQTDFATGEITIGWGEHQSSFVRRTFVSRPANVVVQQLASDMRSHNLSGVIELVNQDQRPIDDQNASYTPPTIEVSDRQMSYRCKYRKSERGYFSVTRVIATDGTATVTEDGLSYDTPELLLLTRVVSVEDWADVNRLFEETVAELDKLPTDYQVLLDEHIEAQRKSFPKVELNLDGGGLRNASNEELLAVQLTDDQRIVPALLERMFDMGRFSLDCSSGELPPNLMGIFNGEWRPKWSGDFTLDANVNLQIAAANIGNVPTAMRSYTNLIHNIADDWRTNARNLFGTRGIVSGTRTDGRHNLNTHHTLGDENPGAFPGFFWTAGAEWLILPMFEHYQVTGNREFARERLLPLMKDVVTFYEDFLVERDDNGKLIFVPSYSPENRPSNSRSPVVINASMDIACAKEACTNLASLCRELDIEPETVARCEKLLAELPPYLVNDDGALKEWAWPSLEDRYDHRHVSHLYPVWPGHEINPEDTPRLFNAARVAATKRGRGNGSAHGLAHMALIGTRLKDAELVYGNLLYMLRGNYILPSLFTYHNPERIYNADMLHSFPAVVIEMLVYSKPGEIELLPALSAKLPTGSLKGALCRCQVQLNEITWDLPQRNVTAQLTSKVNQTITLRVRRGLTAVTLGNGESLPIKRGSEVELKLQQGKPIDLQIVLDR